MNNKNILVIALVLVFIAGISFFTFANQNNPDKEIKDVADKVQQISEDASTSDENSDSTTTESSSKDQDVQIKESTSGETVVNGSYEAYSADKIARAADGTVVLFFHASWCPSCRALNSNIESNRSEIPAGVSILKADYDEETELRKKYGVTTQHTLVQVDKDGNLIKKWSGGSTLDSIISQIN